MKKRLGIKRSAKDSTRSIMQSMKKKQDAVIKPAPLEMHIGTQPVERRREPIVHEKSVLEQLKVIIDKNKRIEEQKDSSE